jgi:hypothetical protein
MSRYLIIINYRTFITLGLSFLVPFIAYNFKVVYNIDLTLMSIAIIFPLVFTIRGAFRRREKAMEHLSRFGAALKTVQNLLVFNGKLNEEEKKEIGDHITAVNDSLFSQLKSSDEDNTQDFDQKMGSV